MLIWEKQSNSTQTEAPVVSEEIVNRLLQRFRDQLGLRVADVRVSERLVESPARLVDPDDSPAQELQRVYKMINQPMEVTPKMLEINPRHALMTKLADLPDQFTHCPTDH